MVGWGIKVGAVRMGLWGWGGCGAALVGSGVFSGRRIGMGYGQRGGLGAHKGLSGHRGCRLCPYGMARLRSPGGPKGHTLWVAMGHILQPNRSPWGTSYSPGGPHGAHPTARGVTSYGSPWGTSYSPRGHTLWVAMGHILQPNRSPWVASYSPRGHTLWVAMGHILQPKGSHPMVPMGHILQPNRSPWVASYSQMDHTL